MEQQLIVNCCYLNLKSKGFAIVSCVEFLAIEESMGENIYIATKELIRKIAVE